MAFEFRFPDVGEGIVEGEIRRWLVKEGDSVKADQPLVEVETDKALVELPAPRGGTVLKIGAGQGETIKVGQVIVVIGEPGEVITESARHESVAVVGHLQGSPREVEVDRIVREPVTPREGKVRAIPSVRKLAQELGVDLTGIHGTGADGRILHEDVIRAAETRKLRPSATAGSSGEEGVERLPMTRLQKTLASTMTQSKFSAPHVTIHDEGDVSRLMGVIARARASAERQGVHLTLLPFVVKSVVNGLKAEPFCNASVDMDEGMILLRTRYHIGIATDTPEGLIVTVVKDADRKSLFDLAREIAVLADRARHRTASIQELTGSTFTISNYGSLGGYFGTPIINPPEVAVLGMGRAREKPVVRDGQIVIRTMLPLSLSFDHRIIDGAISHRFLAVVMTALDNPDQFL
jgi:pyruvate dehydrogenase E2 component (dihydrolipoamide acetyltransferase)